MAKRIGKSIIYKNSPEIAFWAAGVGKKESEGPFGHEFDRVYEDTTLGEDSWEKSESKLLLNTAEDALKKGKMVWDDIDCVFSGDLLSQSIASSFAFRNTGVSICGLYGACSTMALSLITAANTLESFAADTVMSATASHFCSSERQFRYPLEYGEIRTPSAQWTVTGSGAAILGRKNGKVRIRASRIGNIVDMGVSDANNMGAAMAPAAAETIGGIVRDLKCSPADFDMIVTGDLGFIGSDILKEYIYKDCGVDISAVHADCGKLIYYRHEQDVHSGGSGCGCSASMLCSHFLNALEQRKLKRILFVATGALLSPLTVKQKESVPSIAHAVILEGK